MAMMPLPTAVNMDCCPWCDCDPNDNTAHRDGCPTIDTCAQIGPPWVTPHHPDPEPHPKRMEHEDKVLYEGRVKLWWDRFWEHRREAHGQLSRGF